MHQGTTRRASRRRGAPLPPRRRSRRHEEDSADRFAATTGGFEALLPRDGSEDFFFSGWLAEPAAAAEYLEHGGERRAALQADPKVGVTVSAVLHLLIVVFLLVEPSLELLGPRPETETLVAEAESQEPLVLFMEEPAVEPPEVAVVPAPAEPAEPAETVQPTPEQPPQVAEDPLLIPKALLAPPEEKVQEFMNDLPFSEGNTEEFYTDEEVKEPGEEGEPEPAEPPEEVRMARESGEEEILAEESAEASEGSEAGNGGTETDEPTPEEVAALLFGRPEEREAARPRTDIRPPPEPRLRTDPGPLGEGGENGSFTDIRRFLAGARFENPEGGLVANTDNTLYYNDKGANFVPWIHRMLAEVRRNWRVPYSIHFNRGHIAVRIAVARSGTLTDLEVLIPSGVSGFDNAAVGALRAAQLLPLPPDYPDDRFEIILVFWYNERPYDIFG